ncbi:tricorn protease [Thermoflexales bacterium]|nr:tricorn protease [Thermoflexales bacterium]
MSDLRSQAALTSLQRQLAEARANLKLIEERKAEYVLEVDVPLQIIKEERRLKERITKLESDLEVSAFVGAPASTAQAEVVATAAQPPNLAAVVPQENVVPLVEETVMNAGPVAGTPPIESGADPMLLIAPDQRRLLVLLGVVGFIIAAGIVWLVFAQLRCLLEYRVTDGIAALLVFLAGGVAVALSRIIAPAFYHKLLSLYGGIAAALALGILLALFAPPLSRDVCYPAAQTPESNGSQTRTRAVDGMTQVYVSGGTFQMGSTAAEIKDVFELCKKLDSSCTENVYETEAPLHTVTLTGFWMDRTEVTNAQYQLCVDSEQCAKSGFADDVNFNQGDYPVVGVSWFDALHYCAWVSATLPTEAQWEYAARGKDRRAYSWGDDFDGTQLNFCDATCVQESNRYALYRDGYAYTAPVTAFPASASWAGALNLSGNVWEWTNDWYRPYSPAAQTDPTGPSNPTTGTGKVIRGGSWINGPLWVRAARRGNPLPEEQPNFVGFRCVSNTVPLATPISASPATLTTYTALSIIEPKTGQRVSYKTHARGTAIDLPDDRQLWLLVQSDYRPDYFLPSNPLSVTADGLWESIAWIGENSLADTGRTFTLTLVLADAAGSQAFRDFANNASGDQGLAQLPTGAQIVQAVAVERSSPVITVSSHHAGDRVQGYEVLKGTYADLAPSDWQLYAMVSTEPGRFTPFGPFAPTARKGEWQLPVYFPWPTTGRAVSFWLQAVLTGTDAAQRLEKSAGKMLTAADLAAQPSSLYERQAQTEVERHERVAFASDRAGNDDIFIINADSTGLQRLTDDPGADLMPAWSPNGQEIAYVSISKGDQYRLIIRSVNSEVSQTVPITVGSPSMPNWSPDGQWLAFQTWRGDNVDLYKMRRDGSAVKRLTAEGGRYENPVWSPDGQHILYRFRPAQAQDSQSELCVMDANGDNVTPLTNDDAAAGYASWSPDGRRIVFVRDDGENRDIYQMNADGSNIEHLPSKDYDDHPAFAPDGQRYVFDSSEKREQLFVGTTSGGVPMMITTSLAINAEPAWSPTDERIVFVGRYNGDWDLYSMWEDGGEISALADPYEDTGYNEIQPRLSPDGHWVVFVSDIEGNQDIWRKDVVSPGKWQRLTNNPASDQHPAWSPDGQRIALASDRSGNWDIYVMNADGTGVIQLTTDRAADDYPVWTPDGQHLTFMSKRDDNEGDLYQMNVDGRNVQPRVQSPSYDSQPAVSPDGRWLIFSSARDYGGTYQTELYALELNIDRLPVRLTDNLNNDSLPLWSASGQWLYFTSNRYDGLSDIWRMLPDGREPINLSKDHWEDTLGPGTVR